MAVESDADRAQFLSADEFGEALYWPTGAAQPIYGMADTGTVRLEGDGTPGILARHASLMIRASDVPSGAGEGDDVTFRAVAHTVRSIEPDGTGMAVVRLERVN